MRIATLHLDAGSSVTGVLLSRSTYSMGSISMTRLSTLDQQTSLTEGIAALTGRSLTTPGFKPGTHTHPLAEPDTQRLRALQPHMLFPTHKVRSQLHPPSMPCRPNLWLLCTHACMFHTPQQLLTPAVSCEATSKH